MRKKVTKAAEPSPSFTWGAIVNLGGIPLITVVLGIVGGYYLLGDTVKRHDNSIKEIVTARDDERKSREAMRNEFLQSQARLVDVLSKLDTRLAVGEKQQETQGRQLEKINDLLQQRPATRNK